MTPSQQLARDLVSAFPVLGPIMVNHLEDQEGELLPYLFMADVARWADSSLGQDPDTVARLGGLAGARVRGRRASREGPHRTRVCRGDSRSTGRRSALDASRARPDRGRGRSGAASDVPGSRRLGWLSGWRASSNSWAPTSIRTGSWTAAQVSDTVRAFLSEPRRLVVATVDEIDTLLARTNARRGARSATRRMGLPVLRGGHGRRLSPMARRDTGRLACLPGDRHFMTARR